MLFIKKTAGRWLRTLKSHTCTCTQFHWPCVGNFKPCVGIFAACVGILTPCVGILTPCVGILTPCVEILTPCIGIFTPCVGIFTSCVGILTPCVGILTPCVGIFTPCVGIFLTRGTTLPHSIGRTSSKGSVQRTKFTMKGMPYVNNGRKGGLLPLIVITPAMEIPCITRDSAWYQNDSEIH